MLIAWNAISNDDLIRISIMHINDTHGQLAPKDKGGIARIGTLIKEARVDNNNVLVLHAGDEFSRGDDLTSYYYGQVNMLALQAAGFDAFTPGNGDFYFGVKNLLNQTSLVKFPTLLANVFYKKDEKRIFKPYVVKEIGDVKIAILGLGFIRLEHPSGWGLELQDPVKAAKEFVPELRRKADLVVALTHIGLGDDQRLAKEVPQIDIIIGGHSHNKLNKPLRIKRTNGNGEVIIAQAGEYGEFLGQLDIDLSSNGTGGYRMVKAEGRLIPVEKSIKEDAEIVKLLKTYTNALSEVVCISKVSLPNPESGDSPMGSFAAESIRTQTGTSISVLSRSAIQGEIKKGKVTAANISQIHPWHNRILRIKLTGKHLQDVLAKNDVFAAGVSFTKANGKARISNIKSSSFNADGIYTVALDDYLYSLDESLHNISFEDTGETVDSALTKHLKQTMSSP